MICIPPLLGASQKEWNFIHYNNLLYSVDISGDDEQSDWFGEAVGAKGWWADSDRDEDMEPTFQAILTGNLETYRMLADRMVSLSLHLYPT